MTTLIIGSGGIGTATARRLDDHCVLTYRSNKPDDHSGIEFRQLDATDPEAVQQLVVSLEGLDKVVITSGHRHEFEFFKNQDPVVTQEIIETELIAPMNVVRAALKVLPDSARIVIVGSDSGKAGTLGDAASSSARAGLMGFVKSIARETARTDITINIVSPGPTETVLLSDMLEDVDASGSPTLKAKVMSGTVGAIPKGRKARVEEIAEAVAYFLSPQAGFTTGQTLSVSGGLTFS